MATSRNKNNNYNPTGKHKSKRNVIRYFTKDNLKKAILHAENTDKARSVYSDMVFEHIKDHDKKTKYPVPFEMMHNGIEMRMHIAISEKTTITLDIDYDKINAWTHWIDYDGPAPVRLGDINEQS